MSDQDSDRGSDTGSEFSYSSQEFNRLMDDDSDDGHVFTESSFLIAILFNLYKENIFK
jgi:hypothetical protein